MPNEPKRYAVLRRWNDNPNDFEVYDYASTIEEAKRMIASLPKDDARYRWEVGSYGEVS